MHYRIHYRVGNVDVISGTIPQGGKKVINPWDKLADTLTKWSEWNMEAAEKLEGLRRKGDLLEEAFLPGDFNGFFYANMLEGFRNVAVYNDVAVYQLEKGVRYDLVIGISSDDIYAQIRHKVEIEGVGSLDALNMWEIRFDTNVAELHGLHPRSMTLDSSGVFNEVARINICFNEPDTKFLTAELISKELTVEHLKLVFVVV